MDAKDYPWREGRSWSEHKYLQNVTYYGCRDFDITEIDITETAITEFDITDTAITESDITESDITRKGKLL